MSTFAEITAEIAAEIRRNGITSTIKAAILRAIEDYEHEPLWFLQERAEASTVDGQSLYSLPTDFLMFTGARPVKITYNSRKYQMVQATWDDLDDMDIDGATGYPAWWAFGDSQIRVYPTPDGAYTLHMRYQKVLDALSADDDTNAWTTHGKGLIKEKAKYYLYKDTIKQPERAAECFAEAARQLTRLARRHARTVSNRTITAHYL